MSYKTKSILKTVVSVLLIFGALAGCFALIGSIGKKDDGYKTIRPKFSVGGLNQSGKYVETENSIFTKDRFSCKGGLKIMPDFDTNLTYEVYFYDEDDRLVQDANHVTYTEGGSVAVPEGAVYARLVVTPDWTDVPEDDQTIGFFDCVKLAGKITVRVKK